MRGGEREPTRSVRRAPLPEPAILTTDEIMSKVTDHIMLIQVFTDPEGKDPFLRSASLSSSGDLAAPNLKVIQVNLEGVLNTVHVAVGECDYSR